MKALAFDCSTEVLALAVKADSLAYSCVCDSGAKQAESLLPSIENAMARCSLVPAELELVACARGPGSFTGLRIAMSTAKGLAAGSGAAMVSVPTLDYLARPFARERAAVVPLIDARKGRLYAAVFEGGRRLGEYLDCGLEALVSVLEPFERVLFTGPDADIAEQAALGRDGWEIDPYHRSPRAECLIELASMILAERGADEPGSNPLYIRESEADLGITMPQRSIGAPNGRKKD
jgi:tRNA threonylcarbamoyladenosine biosynthesis protein TsaB